MVKVYLTVDPKTGRALYDDESKFLGTFSSVKDAAIELGEDTLNYCSIRTA